MVYDPAMPEFADHDLVFSPSAPEIVTGFDRMLWPRKTVNERRLLLNQLRQCQMEDAFRHQRSLEQAAARQPVPVPTVPSGEQCHELVLTNPGLYAQVSERARDAYNRVRRMEGAPLRALDNRWEEFRRALAGQQPWRQLLKRWPPRSRPPSRPR